MHYAGAPADIDAIRAIGERYGIAVIEDAAHAVGTYYKGRHIGAKGTAIFSFHAIKNITCAEGGLIVTDNENLARQLRMLKFHGLGVDAYDRQTWGRAPQAEVLTPGYKYNLTDINAAIALTQLVKIRAPQHPSARNCPAISASTGSSPLSAIKPSRLAARSRLASVYYSCR